MKFKFLATVASWALSRMDPRELTIFIAMVIHGMNKVYDITEGDIFNAKDHMAEAANVIYDYQNLGMKIQDNKSKSKKGGI